MPKKSKPKSRKRGAPPGVDPNEKRRERLEARRAARVEEARRIERARVRERWTRRTILLGIFALAVWFVFLRGQAPTEINGHTIETFSVAGEGDHTDQPVIYETTPPVSGEHAPGFAPCGIHNQQIPNESQVHTLEHGGVGIQYALELPAEQIASIEELVRDFESHLFSAPYTGMDSPIVVTSWSRMMKLDRFDDAAIREYIAAFRLKGPEADQPCPNNLDNPFSSAVPTPAPSPLPTTTIEGGKNGGGKDRGKGKGGG